MKPEEHVRLLGERGDEVERLREALEEIGRRATRGAANADMTRLQFREGLADIRDYVRDTLKP